MLTKRQDIHCQIMLTLLNHGNEGNHAVRLANELTESIADICGLSFDSVSPGDTETYVPAERRGTGHPLYGQP